MHGFIAEQVKSEHLILMVSDLKYVLHLLSLHINMSMQVHLKFQITSYKEKDGTFLKK
jgi:hypothetical protein